MHKQWLQKQRQQTVTAFPFHSFCESNLSTENHLNAIEILHVENYVRLGFCQCVWQLTVTAKFAERKENIFGYYFKQEASSYCRYFLK